jgi:uncharacterized protein (TIGR00661 family)
LKEKKTILACPLDWGLGHATRMVPVIELLEQKGARVIIAADNRPLEFLKQRFPGKEFVTFPGFVPEYPEKGSMAFAMARSLPKMLQEAKKSNTLLRQLIEEENIDVVISDNRYELYSTKVPCIFITHQLNIQTSGWQKLAEPAIKKTINAYIKKYDELWIPDLEGDKNLSGELSHIHKMPIENTHFIGTLSRFSNLKIKPTTGQIDLLILISGPEPQRSLLEEMLTKQALQTNLKTVILQGKPEATAVVEKENVKIIPHLPDAEMGGLIHSAKIIISRPGYSSLMDLSVFGTKAIFIPTPGQTEQEYLAGRLQKQGIAFTQKQNEFDLKTALHEAKKFSGLTQMKNNAILEKRIDLLLGL